MKTTAELLRKAADDVERLQLLYDARLIVIENHTVQALRWRDALRAALNADSPEAARDIVRAALDLPRF